MLTVQKYHDESLKGALPVPCTRRAPKPLSEAGRPVIFELYTTLEVVYKDTSLLPTRPAFDNLLSVFLPFGIASDVIIVGYCEQ